jgi:hypothetical protein
MARTAPTTFGTVESGAYYPLEPILSGAGGDAEWQTMMQNINHVYRYMVPIVVRQDMVSTTVEYVPSTSTSYVTTHTWRIPTFGGDAGQTAGGAVWAHCPTGSGKVTISATGGASQEMSFSGAAISRQTFTGLTLVTSGAYTEVSFLIKVDVGGDEIRAINVDIWLEPSASPLAALEDGNGFYPMDDSDGANDEPLPTFLVRRMAENLDKIAERPGVCLSFSDDYRGARSNFNTQTALRAVERMPVRYGPKTTKLRVHANGYCNDTVNTRLRIWTDQQSKADALELTLPTNGAWTASPLTSWVTGTVDLAQQAGIDHTWLNAEIEGNGVGNEADLFSLCVWEEV